MENITSCQCVVKKIDKGNNRSLIHKRRSTLLAEQRVNNISKNTTVILSETFATT